MKDISFTDPAPAPTPTPTPAQEGLQVAADTQGSCLIPGLKVPQARGSPAPLNMGGRDELIKAKHNGAFGVLFCKNLCFKVIHFPKN